MEAVDYSLFSGGDGAAGSTQSVGQTASDYLLIAKQFLATQWKALIAGVLLVVVVLLIANQMGWVNISMNKNGKSSGVGSAYLGQLDCGDNGLICSRFTVDVTAEELPPTKVPIVDGTDAIGSFRYGKSGSKYYLVTYTNPQNPAQVLPAMDESGNVVYRLRRLDEPGWDDLDAMQVLKLNYNDDKTYANYKASCKISNPDDGDVWGWMNARLRYQQQPAGLAKTTESAIGGEYTDRELAMAKSGY